MGRSGCARPVSTSRYVDCVRGARAQNEAWRTWIVERRPFVIYKAAVTLDGRVTLPGERWVTRRGEPAARARAARRRRCGRRRRAAPRAPTGRGSTRATSRRRVGSRGDSSSRAARCPTASTSSSAAGRSTRSFARSRGEGVQSLLLEGGPTLAAAFLAADLVDKVLLFVAPALAAWGRLRSLRYPPRARCRAWRPGRWATTCFSKPMSTSPDIPARRRPARHAPEPLADPPARERRAAPQGRADRHRRARARRPRRGRELLVELATAVPGERGQLEVLVRETVETLVYGD